MHTFDSVLPLFIAALGHPSTIVRPDEDFGYGPIGRSFAQWFLDLADPYRCYVSLEDEGDEVTVFARNATSGGEHGGIKGWELNHVAPPTGCELATPEEALRLATEWAKVAS